VKNDLSVPLPVIEWLHGASLVRPRIHNLEMVRLLNDSFNINLRLSCRPIQLPYRKNDTWLAVEFQGRKKQSITTRFRLCSTIRRDLMQPNCSAELLIDSWTEIIPNKKETTGIGFNYNQPNTVPPQALLLVVTPEITGHWKWENLVCICARHVCTREEKGDRARSYRPNEWHQHALTRNPNRIQCITEWNFARLCLEYKSRSREINGAIQQTIKSEI
jgi:hypothetical protein